MPNKLISATAQLEEIAERIVSAGAAHDLDAGIALAVERNPELYRVSCSEKIRPEIAREIEEMVKGLEPSAREELGRLADAAYLKGDAKTESDAWVFAIQQNPELFQKWRDDQQAYYDKCHEGMAKTADGLDAHKVVLGASAFESKARALVTAGHAVDIDDAFGKVAASDPAAYSEYLKTLG